MNQKLGLQFFTYQIKNHPIIFPLIHSIFPLMYKFHFESNLLKINRVKGS